MLEKEANAVFDMYTEPKASGMGATFTLFKNGKEIASRTVFRPAKTQNEIFSPENKTPYFIFIFRGGIQVVKGIRL